MSFIRMLEIIQELVRAIARMWLNHKLRDQHLLIVRVLLEKSLERYAYMENLDIQSPENALIIYSCMELLNPEPHEAHSTVKARLWLLVAYINIAIEDIKARGSESAAPPPAKALILEADGSPRDVDDIPF